MADVTVSAAGVAVTTSTVVSRGTAGGTITAGQPLYIDPANSSLISPARADTAVHSACIGLALHGASANQPIAYATGGSVTLSGTTLGVGMPYFVSTNAGGLAPMSDLSASSGSLYGAIVGIATTATNFLVGPLASGVIKA